MPSYNRDHYLADAVKSVIDQTLKDWDMIIVDDGSTDHSKELYNYYTKLDKRIKVIYLPKNMGIAYARNVGNKEAQGEFIAVMDSDDIMNPDRLEISLKKIKKYDAVYSGYRKVSPDLDDIGYVDPPELTKDALKYDQVVPHPTLMARKECFIEHPYRNELRVNDDLALVLDWYTAGYRFKKIENDLLMAYREHAGSVSISKLKEVQEVTEALKKEFKGIYEED